MLIASEKMLMLVNKTYLHPSICPRRGRIFSFVPNCKETRKKTDQGFLRIFASILVAGLVEELVNRE